MMISKKGFVVAALVVVSVLVLASCTSNTNFSASPNNDLQMGTIGGNPMTQHSGSNMTASNSMSVKFQGSTTAGNAIVVRIGLGAGVTISSVTDTQGNTYYPVIVPVPWGSGQQEALYYTSGIIGGQNAISVNVSANTTLTGDAYEYAGFDPVTPLDMVASATGTGTSITTPTITTNFAKEVAFGFGEDLTSLPTAVGNFLGLSTTGDALSAELYGNLSGPLTLTESLSSSSSWVGELATFRAPATTPFVQSIDVSVTGTTTASTSFHKNNTAGDLIVLAVTWCDGTSTVSSITDTAGNTYAAASNSVLWGNSGARNTSQLFYAKDILGGANTAKVVVSATQPQCLEIHAFEYSGRDKNAPLDAVNGSAGFSTNMTGSVSAQKAGEMVFSFNQWSWITPTYSASGNPSPGFYKRGCAVGGCMGQDLVESSAGSYSTSGTLTATSEWVSILATFK